MQFIGVMIDQHFPDSQFITFSKFDPVEQINLSQKAGVDSNMITTKCHWGYTYYPTSVGLMHPALNGRDMVGELVSQSHKAGIEAIAYYCFQFDNIAARNNTKWKFITDENQPAILRDQFAKHVPDRLITETHVNPWHWDMACINTGYRKYCLDQISEFSSRYDFDALFLDIFAMQNDFFANVCYCTDCLQEYSQQGLEPYSADTEMRIALIKYWISNWAVLLEDIKQILLMNGSNIPVSINGGPFEQGWQVLKNVDWPYSEGAQNPHNAVTLSGIGLSNSQCGISPGPNVYDVWSTNLARIWTSTVLAHGSCTFFFFMHGRSVDGTFEQSKYDIVSEINKEVENIQNYVKDAKPLTAAAVYYSESSGIAAGAWNKSSQQQDTIAAIINVFRSKSIPCEFLPNWQINTNQLKQFQLIVVPEQECLSEEETTAFTTYVENGGCLLVSGRSGLMDNDGKTRSNFAMAELMGVDYLETSKEYTSQRVGGYLNFEEHPFFKDLPNKHYNMWGNFLKILSRDAEVIAHVTEPIAVETQDNYIGWRELPPGDKSDWPCITVARRGRGKVIYSVAPLAQYIHNGDKWPGVFIESITKAIGLNWGVRWKGPPIVSEATFFRKDNNIVIHILNQSIRHNEGVIVTLPANQIECSIYEPIEARLVYPNQEELEIKDGLITVPPVSIHSVVVLTLPKDQQLNHNPS